MGGIAKGSGCLRCNSTEKDLAHVQNWEEVSAARAGGLS